MLQPQKYLICIQDTLTGTIMYLTFKHKYKENLIVWSTPEEISFPLYELIVVDTPEECKHICNDFKMEDPKYSRFFPKKVFSKNSPFILKKLQLSTYSLKNSKYKNGGYYPVCRYSFEVKNEFKKKIS